MGKIFTLKFCNCDCDTHNTLNTVELRIHNLTTPKTLLASRGKLIQEIKLISSVSYTLALLLVQSGMMFSVFYNPHIKFKHFS